MNIKMRVATIATAAFIAVGAAGGAVAQGNTVTQEIGRNSTGNITAYVDNGALEAKPFSFNAQTSTGTLLLHVKDDRGTNDGWNVKVQSGDFQAPGVNKKIEANKFEYTGPGTKTAIVGDASNLQTSDQAGTFNNQLKILRADQGWGTGEFTMGMGVKLNIPEAQPVGIYTTTLTVTTSSGPGN